MYEQRFILATSSSRLIQIYSLPASFRLPAPGFPLRAEQAEPPPEATNP